MVALASPVVSWAAWPFYEAAVRNARHRVHTMDTLVSLGILAATGWSLYSMFFRDADARSSLLLGLAHGSGGGIYLDVPAGVTTFLLAGRYFEAWSRQRSGDALRALAAVGATGRGRPRRQRPRAATRGGGSCRGGPFRRPPGRDRGDRRRSRARAVGDRPERHDRRVPAGRRGWRRPVLGGTVSLTGRMVVRATRVGRDTQLGQMLRLVEHAQNEKAAVQQLADRVSSVFVPAVLLIALGTLVAWRLTGNPATAAFSAALSVLIIACPCALGLATPAALLVASWAGARLGIFFKGYRALETSRHLDTVVLDKTGTLTEGQMTLADLEAVAGVEQREVLRLAGSGGARVRAPGCAGHRSDGRALGRRPARGGLVRRAARDRRTGHRGGARAVRRTGRSR